MTARRVLHVINNLNLGGAEMMLVRLLGRLDRTRWSPHVVSLIGGGPAAERLESIGVPVTFLGMRRGLPGPVSLLRLLRSVHMNSPDWFRPGCITRTCSVDWPPDWFDPECRWSGT